MKTFRLFPRKEDSRKVEGFRVRVNRFPDDIFFVRIKRRLQTKAMQALVAAVKEKFGNETVIINGMDIEFLDVEEIEEESDKG